MVIERLIEQIQKLTPQQKKELFRRFGFTLPEPEKDEMRGRSDDPLTELIGMPAGIKSGCVRWESISCFSLKNFKKRDAFNIFIPSYSCNCKTCLSPETM